MTDVLLYDTLDGGELALDGSSIVLTTGLDTAVYLSLFGGNEYDTGLSDDSSDQWWGNLLETDTSKHLRGQLQALLLSTAPNSGNLQRFRDAANNDLRWLTSKGLAKSIDVQVRVLKVQQLQIDISIVINGNNSTYSFSRSSL